MPVVYSRKRIRAEEAAANENAKCNNSTKEDLVGTKKDLSETPIEQNNSSTYLITNTTNGVRSSQPFQKRKRKKRMYTQLHLDFGQRDSGPVQCPKCGLLYTKGQAEDEATHQRHHLAVIRSHLPQSFGRIPPALVIRRVRDGVVIGVDGKEDAVMQKRVINIDKWVSGQLGGFMRCISLDECETGWLAVLFVIKQVVRGYLLAEEVRDVCIGNVRPDGVVETIAGSNVVGSFCGVRKIWVDNEYRRQGIAKLLLDVVRNNLVYGKVFTKSEVAFTPMTTDGALFAKGVAYECGRTDVLVYTSPER